MDDTSSMGPLWSEDERSKADERSQEQAIDESYDEGEGPVAADDMATHLMPEVLEEPATTDTVLMDAASLDEQDGDELSDATKVFSPEADELDEADVEESDEPVEALEAEAPAQSDAVEEDVADEESDATVLMDEADLDDDESDMFPDLEEAIRAEEASMAPINVIDVGEQDLVYGTNPRLRHAAAAEAWRGRTRPSDRFDSGRSLSMTTVAIVAALAIVLGFMVAYFVLGGHSSEETTSEEQSTEIVSKRVSSRKAAEVIAGLDGWWKTDRTYDGRYWHIQEGLMETYAADGVLAGQVLIDPDSIGEMTAGPDGIEGEGYYLRDIAYYLTKDDPDTLHAIGSDGTANEDGNLMRTDPPAFMTSSEEGGETETTEVEEADSSEYMLPDSATRVYDISELESMSDHDLFVARNEIYARHGYVFEAGELSEYFSSKSWYHPAEVFNEGDITEIERQNVSLILSIEQSRGSQYV